MPEQHAPPHRTALLQAILVTFLWSTSWVLIKRGLGSNLPALTLAGLRYSLAFLCLVPVVVLNPAHRQTLHRLPLTTWLRLAALGLLVYALTQGTQFLSLASLPAAMVSLLLNLTSVLVAMAGMVLLHEKLTLWQGIAVLASAVGVAIYFAPARLPAGQIWGLVAAVVCLLGNTGSALMGRHINRSSNLPPLIITFISMGSGAIVLLVMGLLTQGVGPLSWTQVAIIVWLALVNTALAFTLWNNSLRTLTATESSVINNLMLPQIAILAYLFLGEGQTWRQIAGLALVALGTLIVQLARPVRQAARTTS